MEKVFKQKRGLKFVLSVSAFLICYAAAMILNLTAVPAQATTAYSLWKGSDISATNTKDGTRVATSAPKESVNFDYYAALPLVIERTLVKATEGDANATETQPAEYFNLKFFIENLNCTMITFKFTDKNDEKKFITITLEFPEEYSKDDNANFKVITDVDKKSQEEALTDAAQRTTEFHDVWIGSGSEEDPYTEFEIVYNTDGSFRLNVKIKDSDGNTVEDKSQALFGNKIICANDTANLNITYGGGSTEADKNTALVFSELNKQTLKVEEGKYSITIEKLPVLSVDKKVDTADINPSGDAKLKAYQKTSVNLPVYVSDAVNTSIKYYLSIKEPGVAEPVIKDSTTAVYFADLGEYEIKVYAGNFDTLDKLKEAVKATEAVNEDEKENVNGYGKAVVMTFKYTCVKTKNDAYEDWTPEEDKNVDNGQNGYKAVEEFFNTPFQVLPKYLEDFKFPKPDFKDPNEPEYCLKYTIAYKYESSTQFTKSSSLSFNINQVGWFTFRYIVTNSAGKETDFRADATREFKVYFHDLTAPEIKLYTTTYDKTQGDAFSIPTPTVNDNSSSGGSLIEDKTKMYLAEELTSSSEGLTEVELTDEKTYILNDIKTYYFWVEYQANDKYNNTSELTGFLLTVKVTAPVARTDRTTLLIILIITGSLSFAGVIILLFIKPIDDEGYVKETAE